ncbi:flavin reductase family protein [Streptomyces mangrovisoli]|uniref:Flavin reductase n=1 Tax=Streptomyces mangrovisoli TaxID=1428628 RepID=A0A1J4NSF1_9ACTN|nr:flavin reductase family protein [Streptomyces mangrovisoli]OIJ65401.1 flavin reductase [Streptomyces mangrovisoli]
MTTLRDVRDTRVLRDAYGCFPSGVAAVCGLVDGSPVGMAVSSFTSVSLTPALVSVCLRNSSATWDRLSRLPRLGVSVLAEHQDGVCRQLSRGGPDGRFHGLGWRRSDAGAVFVGGAAAWFDCSVFALLPGGDHTVALLEVHGLSRDQDRSPLVFHGGLFRRLAPGAEVGRAAEAGRG